MKKGLNNYKEMFLYSKINKKSFLLLVFISMLMAVSNIFIALQNNYLIDNITNINILSGVIYIVSILTYTISSRQYIYLTRLYKSEVKFNLQKDILLKIPENKEQWFMKLDMDSEIFSNYVFRTIIPLIYGSLEFILALIYGFLVSWRLTVIILVLSSLSILFPRFLLNYFKKDMEEKLQSETNFKNFIINFLENFIVIQSFNAYDFLKKEFNKLYLKQENDIFKVKKKQYFFMSFTMGLGFLMNTLWMVIAMFMINSNKLTLGILVGFMSINNSFNWLFFEMPNLLVSLKEQKTSYDRLNEYKYDKHNMLYDSSISKKSKEIIIENICFKFEDREIIENFSATINENTIIYGESGVGKTTLLKLISGIYTPNNGSVFVDGEEISNNNSSKYFSYVPQQEAIFHDTIKNNILLGNPSADFSQIEKAAKQANIHSFINSLPKKYNTIIGESSKIDLSYGQKKRISLAKAFIKNANIILLDEPTADMDLKTKEYIFDSLKQYTGIVIMVSHEENAIELFDNKIKLGN